MNWVFLLCLSIVGSYGQRYPNIFTVARPFVGFSVDIVTKNISSYSLMKFKYTENKNSLWNGQTFLIPDFTDFSPVQTWELNKGGIVNSTKMFFENYVAKTPLYRSAVIDGRQLTGAFNKSRWDSIFNNSQNIARLYGLMSEFRLQISPGFEVEDWFMKASQSLPSVYSRSNCNPFWKFFPICWHSLSEHRSLRRKIRVPNHLQHFHLSDQERTMDDGPSTIDIRTL